ncbi:MAG: hypothetical protein QXK07_03400 [Desulfurococcaceae archaeon]
MKLIVFSHPTMSYEDIVKYIDHFSGDLDFVVYIGPCTLKHMRTVAVDDKERFIVRRATQCLKNSKLLCSTLNSLVIVARDDDDFNNIVKNVRALNENLISITGSSEITKIPDPSDAIKQVLKYASITLNELGFTLHVRKEVVFNNEVQHLLEVRDSKRNNLVVAYVKLGVRKLSKPRQGRRVSCDFELYPREILYLMNSELKVWRIEQVIENGYRPYVVKNPFEDISNNVTVLEYLASLAKYGLIAVYWDNNSPVSKHLEFNIDLDSLGKNVYIPYSPFHVFKAENFVIVAIPAVPAGVRTRCYRGLLRSRVEELYDFELQSGRIRCNVLLDCSNCDYTLSFSALGKLGLQEELIGVLSSVTANTLQLIVISHCPRVLDVLKGKLDELRNWKFEIPLVISACPSFNGGRIISDWNGSTVVNLAHMDFLFDKLKSAYIYVSSESGVVVDIFELPPPVRRYDRKKKINLALERLGLSENERRAFEKLYDVYGDKLLEDVPALEEIKRKYSIPYAVVFTLYRYGFRRPEHLLSITMEVVEKLVKEHPMFKYHITLMLNKIRRAGMKSPCLLEPLVFKSLNDIILFDTEYDGSPDRFVLIGFYDPVCDSIDQFTLYEQDKAYDYIRRRADRLFVHYGGADKPILRRLARGIEVKTFDLLQFVVKSLVLPGCFANDLKSIHRELCGYRDEPWWKKNFYDVDGFMKACMCRRVLRPQEYSVNASIHLDSLKEMNKADLIALKELISAVMRLPCCKE